MAKFDIETRIDRISPKLRTKVFTHITARWWDSGCDNTIDLFDKSIDDLLVIMVDMGYREPKWYQIFRKPAWIQIYDKD